VKKTPDDGQRNCPKHVEFYCKNKFEKLVHSVGFIIRIYHDARSRERQKKKLKINSQVAAVSNGSIENSVIETQWVSDRPLSCAEPTAQHFSVTNNSQFTVHF